MANAGAIRAGRAFIELFTKLDIDKGLNAASARIKQWGSGLKHIGTKFAFLGAAITAPIALAAKQIADLDNGTKRREFRKNTGVAVSTADVASAKAFSVALGGIGANLSLIAVKLATAVMPIIKQFSEWLASVIKPISEWIANNRELVQTIFKIGVALAVIGAGLVIIGTIVSVMGSVVAVIGAIVGVITSPIFLAIAATVALGAAMALVLYKMGAFDSIIPKLANSFKVLGQLVMNGNIGLAWDIVCKGIEIGWTQMLDNMLKRVTAFASMLAEPMVALGLVDATAILGLSSISASYDDELKRLKSELDALAIQAVKANAALPPVDEKKKNAELASVGTVTRGTFNGLLAEQILGGPGGVQERIATNTKEGAATLRRIEKKVGPTKVH